jgi:biopolymer transport protein ExbB
MKRSLSSLRFWCAWLGLVATLGAAEQAAESLDAALKRAKDNYVERLQRAAEELAATRQRVAQEKEPFLKDLRAAEDRILAAEIELNRFQTHGEVAASSKRKLIQDLDAQRKTAAYLNTLSRDSLKALQSGLAVGEEQVVADRMTALERAGDDASTAATNVRGAIDVADFLLGRTERALGGHVATGSALLAATSQLVPGRIAFVGPETFFLPDGGGMPGVLRMREGSKFPTSHPLRAWKPDEAAAFFAGQPATMVGDASNGKALKLEQTSGTLLEHIKKGGVVAYLIVGVGVLALVIVLGKLRDLAQMKVDSRETVQAFLSQMGERSTAESQVALKALQPTTRELFAEGLRQRHEPRSILEERLESVLLGLRLHFERRLPLLAVIATAAPLMGLLGTVVGMVKTFTLITVFGTGNAAKLSSGISEVLVATELGLAVAIPALVVHGFLAHRIHKNLTLLERHALEFLTAAEVAKLRTSASDESPALVG